MFSEKWSKNEAFLEWYVCISSRWPLPPLDLELYSRATQKVDQKNPQGFSALMVAADKGNMEIAKALVDRGARVAAKDDDGETAVMKSAAKGYSARIFLTPSENDLLVILFVLFVSNLF